MYEWVDNPATIDPTFSLLPRDEQSAILAALQRAKDDSTTTPSTPTAEFKKVAPQVERLDLAELRARYPPQTKTLAERVADGLAACEGCTGTCRHEREFDRFWIPTLHVEDGEEVVRYGLCRFGRQRALERKFRSSRIPSRYLGKTFADYRVDNENRKAVDFAKNVLNSKQGAYFFGECGTGKTFLASLIAQEFLRDGKSVVFVKVPSLLDDIKSTFDGKGNELDLLDKLQAATLVVLDDFGMEKSTQWAGSTLCKILDMRYDNPQAVTIVTSNLSLNELAAHLNRAADGDNLNGSRIADRLREICKPILFKGTTRRN